MFLIFEKNFMQKQTALEKRFNPLNQVYVFNNRKDSRYPCMSWLYSFNPLNQVYVFNLLKKCGDKYAAMVKS